MYLIIICIAFKKFNIYNNYMYNIIFCLYYKYFNYLYILLLVFNKYTFYYK